MKKMNMNAQSDKGERKRGGGVMDANPSLLLTKKTAQTPGGSGPGDSYKRFVTALHSTLSE